jgi:hypothetical protein
MTKQADDLVTRVNYFNGQFLVAKDFTVEQNYHREMLVAHNKAIHGWGVVEGFDVLSTEGLMVTVKDGMAIDKQGRQIIQKTVDGTKEHALSRSVASGDYICLRYKQSLSNKSEDACIDDNTRYVEEPKIWIGTSGECDDGKGGILLAQVDTIGSLVTSVKKICPLRVTEPEEVVEVTGNLTVTGDLTVTGVGPAKSADGQTNYKIVAGKQEAEWIAGDEDFFDVAVDTTIDGGMTANFSDPPMYFVTVEYTGAVPPASEIKSATVYNASSTGFSVRYWSTDITDISINWIAIGN